MRGNKMEEKKNIFQQTKEFLVGGARSVRDPNIFHTVSLMALMAWIGLGADGMTSSCYGPEEAFLALGSHYALGIFVALASVITIVVISMSYSQLIELFPAGGGGYLVASKLLSPTAGVVSGSALIIDYVLTISLSIASGADALFSFLPAEMYHFKIWVAAAGVLFLMMMNLRGVKESISVISPIFMVFVITHVVIIIYAFVMNASNFAPLAVNTTAEIKTTSGMLGIGGMIILILRAYSMGAGTFTGIEAVSNGMNVFMEPKVKNAKKTMVYMAASLSFLVLGITVSYVLFKLNAHPGKTLNAVLFDTVTQGWGAPGKIFVLIALISEALLLFVAAQTGFIGGPAIIANMARDRWLPTRFSLLSDRLVAHNGIFIMSGAALVTLFLAKGSVKFLVVLYSINVFITFSLAQLGMVVHWWSARKKEAHWRKKLAVNGIGLALTTFILIMVTVIKFADGGWITVVITTALIALCFYIKEHYKEAGRQLMKLDTLIEAAVTYSPDIIEHEGAAKKPAPAYDNKSKTAVVFVNGFNGLGMHTVLSVVRLFGTTFKNFVFVQIGVIDTGNFKGTEEVDKLNDYIKGELDSYVNFMKENGYYAEGYSAVGTDVVEEANALVPKIRDKFSDPIFFGGQLVFKEDTVMNNLLHNYMVFQLQQSFYHQGITFVILPIRVY
jgi:amino acid transporter